MIRVLLMIAGAGFVLAVACLSAAIAIGGPDAVARGGWTFFNDHGGKDAGARFHQEWKADGPADKGPKGTRTLTWTGGSTVQIEVPGDVRYVQAAGPATVTVSGPEAALRHVVVKGERLGFDTDARWRPDRFQIVIRAPDISRFQLSGANTLKIEDYDQDRLAIDLSGAAEVEAKGRARSVELDISGTGNVDLSALKTEDADVEISGAGGATIAPTESAKLSISGLGDIRMLTRPARLESDISGAGRVRDEAPEAAKPERPVKGDRT